MSKPGRDRRREARLLVRGLSQWATEVQSLGDPQATAPRVPQQYPTEGQGSSGVPPPTPILSCGGSLLGSALPGTLGGEWEYPTSMYRNCLQVPSGMDYGDVGATGNICHSQSSCPLLYAQHLMGFQVHSRHSMIFAE